MKLSEPFYCESVIKFNGREMLVEERALSNRFCEIEEEMDRNYYHHSTDSIYLVDLVSYPATVDHNSIICVHGWRWSWGRR